MPAFVRIGRRWINLNRVDLVSIKETAQDQPSVTLHFGSQRTLDLKDAEAQQVFAILGQADQPRTVQQPVS